MAQAIGFRLFFKDQSRQDQVASSFSCLDSCSLRHEGLTGPCTHGLAKPSSFSRLSCGADRTEQAASGAAATAANALQGCKLGEHREAIRATIAAMKTAAKKRNSLALGVLALVVVLVSTLLLNSAAIASSVSPNRLNTTASSIEATTPTTSPNTLLEWSKTRAEVSGPFTANLTERSSESPVNSSRIYDPLDEVALECTVAPVNGLADLPYPTRHNQGFVRARELLDEANIKRLHPINPDQMLGTARAGHGGVRNLSNDDLIKFGGPQGTDPITVNRVHTLTDDPLIPGSRLEIQAGHHRLEEIRRRVQNGTMSPDTIIEVVQPR
jgi:hypothetical protein